LAFKVAGGGQVLPYTAVLYELGSDFLYVDGQCRYWISQPSTTADNYSAWRPFRQGALTAEQELALHRAVSYDDVGHRPTCTQTGTVDAGAYVLWDGLLTSICPGNLDAPADWPLRTELFQAATEMTGPMRAVAGKDTTPSDTRLYHWVLAEPPENYAIDYSEGMTRGKSRLVATENEASALRALRSQVITDAMATPGLFYGLIFVDRPGFALVMRDDLPFTRPTDGLWAPP
jgi:hypothetical protein